MKQQTVGKYAHLEYEVLHRLEITIPEFWYLDMVYQLSRDGWCWKSLDNIALDMRLTKNGVFKMRERLTDKGFIIKGRGGKVKTSVKYNSVYRLDKATYNSVTKRDTEYNNSVQLSITKNNSKINKDSGNVKRASRQTVSNIRQMLSDRGVI